MVLLITAGCRLGFDDVDPATTGDDGSGSGSGSGSSGVQPQLTCSGPQRFVVGNDLAGIAATSTSDGFAVATVDTNGNVKGWSFELDSAGSLNAGAQNIALGAGANGTVGIASSAANVIVAASNSGGTAMFALAETTMAKLNAPTMRTDFAGPTPLASVGGTYAFISQLSDTTVQLTQLDSNAQPVGSTLALTATADMAYSPTVVAGPNGYAVVYGAWNLDGGAAISLYDTNMNQLIAPQKIEPNPSYFAEQPVIAYAAQSNEYFVSWHIKDSSNFDHVYGRLLGTDFTPVGDPFEISPFSNNESVSTDGTNFFLSYVIYDPNNVLPDKLGASQITSGTGAVTPISITGDGGTPSKWTFVARDAQTVLVWRETGGSGPDLYFDPMCN
jgi:hypothetical protein